MKKTRRFFLALLPMAVALIFASCGSSDEVAEPTPATGTKTIPVKITVGMDDATRATVGNDNSTLYFHTADKLAVLSGGSCIALLENTTIAEGSSSATFQGNMTVPSNVSSYGEVTVVLIGNENIGVQTTTNYSWANNGPAICVANGSSSALNEAVKKYSYLTGTGTFNPAGENNYTLTQHTAFLNVAVTFKDGTAANENLSVTVTNNSSTIGTGTVTTETDATSNDVVAKFVVPVAAGTTMNGATIVLGSSDPITLSSTATLAGQSYRVEKTLIGGYEGVQLWEGGPYWATKNVGAMTPEEYGDYYAWSETTSKGNYGESTYTHANGSMDKLTKYVSEQYKSFSYNGEFYDNRWSLESSDDAAISNMGNGWRTPTSGEMNVLLSNKTTRTEYFGDNKYPDENGENGILFTGTEVGYTNKSIFLPAAGSRNGTTAVFVDEYGFYWTSSCDLNNPGTSIYAIFYSSNNTNVPSYWAGNSQNGACYLGMPIRAVHD